MNDNKEIQKRRVLILGLDGATFDLIKPWVADGFLPTFKKLMAKCVWGELKVELPPGTVPNWPSFATGKNPGKHGLIWWVKQDPKINDYSVISSNDLRGQTMWDIVGQYGLNVGVVNVPVTYPPNPVNGFLISGLLTPPNAKKTYPDDLMDELEKNVGTYKVFPQTLYRRGNEKAYLDEIHSTLNARLKATIYLMRNRPWDLFCVVFGATDWVMHAFWKYQDADHPDHDPIEAKLYGNAILSIYQHVDKALASLLEEIGKDTSLIIMSDHGAGPGIAKSMINNWLLEIGMLHLKRNIISRMKYFMWRLGFTLENIYPLVDRLGLLNVNIKKKVDPRRLGSRSLFRRIFLSYNDVDWSRTKAFTMGGMGQIHINVRGKNPNGCVEPGEEYEKVCQTIVERVVEITLPNSNKSFVKRAIRREELFHGEHLNNMPDIILLPTDMRYLDSGVEFASNKMFARLGAVSGAHRSNGILMMCGSNLREETQLSEVSIRDIAPTTLHLLGIPIPSDMDGRVITEAMDEDFMDMNPVKTTSKQALQQQQYVDGDKTDQDEEVVRQRLANLGYLD